MRSHTRTTRTARAVLVVLAGGALALGPAIAPAGAADSTLGSTFTPSVSCGSGITVLQTGSPGNVYTVPAAGVVTSWTFVVGAIAPANVGLRIGRAAAGSFDIVGSSTPTAPAAGETTVTRPTRLAVAAGDVIGSYVDNNGQCVQMASAAFTFTGVIGNVTSGSINANGMAQSSNMIQVDIAAKVEPDADGDGFGDTTQDLCPTKAATQKECVAPVTSVVAKAGKAKRKANGTFKKAKVTVAFAVNEASTSTCSIDGSAATACTSPRVFKAKKGAHLVTVTSTDALGNVGAPVSTRVTVKKAKSKKK